MKKAILILLCCVILTVTVSCNKLATVLCRQAVDKQQSGDSNTLNTESNTLSSLIPDNADIIDNISTPSQLEFYYKFQDDIAANEYDKWLASECSEGKRSENVIYEEYGAMWKDELAFTIQNGKDLFEDDEEYNRWKSNLEQWLVYSQEILKTEMSLFTGTLQQLEIIVPYCKLVRQKTIDTKKFLYYYEKEKLGLLDIHHTSITIVWKYSNK